MNLPVALTMIDNPPYEQCVIETGKKTHIFICEEENGQVLGAILKPDGVVKLRHGKLCTIKGFYDADSNCYYYRYCSDYTGADCMAPAHEEGGKVVADTRIQGLKSEPHINSALNGLRK